MVDGGWCRWERQEPWIIYGDAGVAGAAGVAGGAGGAGTPPTPGAHSYSLPPGGASAAALFYLFISEISVIFWKI